jgi:hypothetical protein
MPGWSRNTSAKPGAFCDDERRHLAQAREESIMGMLDKAREAAASLAGKAGDLTGAGLDKLKQTVDDIMDGSAKLRAVGYRLTDVELMMSLLPRAILRLVKEFDATDEAFTGALRDNAGNKTLCTVLKMLQQVDYVKNRVPVKGRVFKELIIDLGVPPAVSLRYMEPGEATP